MRFPLRPLRRAIAVLWLLPISVLPARSQILLDSTEQLAWDRPEAWAMRYFTSVSLMSGFGASDRLEKGAISVGLDAGWVPSLSEEERRVGFIGTKVEDLNRTSGFGRLRARFALPAGWIVTAGWVPPVEIDGVTPRVFNLALERSLLVRDPWSISARIHGQRGSLEGDLTCPEDIVGSGDPMVNPDNCLEPSSDEVTMDSVGIDWTLTRTAGDRWRPYLSLSVNYFDLEFQVRARYSLFLDRGRLVADGWSPSVALGARRRTQTDLAFAGEIFYAPLKVVRNPPGSTNDPLLTVRMLIEYRIR